jgi:hypothetical protein
MTFMDSTVKKISETSLDFESSQSCLTKKRLKVMSEEVLKS